MTNCRECWDDGYIWTHPSGSEDDKPRFEKCDACGILKSDSEAQAKAGNRKYFLVWWNGFQVNMINGGSKPVSSELLHEDFNEDHGWHEEDIEEVSCLKIGEKYDTGGPIENVTIYRYA